MNASLNHWLQCGHTFLYRNHSVFYVTEGSGECLLVVHGYPYSGYDFKHLLPELATNFQVLIPDMPGMGFSDKPADYEYCFKNHVQMYRELLQHLGIKKIHVLAHDIGNNVVQEMLAQVEAGDHSLSITSIAFLNGGLFSDVYRPRPLQVLLSKSPAFIGRLLSRLISKKSIQQATCSVFGKQTQPSAELLNEWWEILNYKNGKSIAWKIGRLVFERDVHQQRWISAMQQTHIPMCFINGPADPNSGIHMAQRYTELIPYPRLYLLPKHIGHWPQIEAPQEVLQVLEKFWSDIN